MNYTFSVFLVEVEIGHAEFASSLALVHPRGEPFLALFDVFLAEGHGDGVVVLVAVVAESDAMALHVGKVSLGLLRRRSTQTFVVLDTVRGPVVRFRLPFFEFGQRVEAERRVGAFGRFDDGRDELLEEGQTQQRRPVVMEKVDEQTFDVRSVLILIGHDHQSTVAQGFQVGFVLVLFLVLQSENLDQIVDFCVFQDLLVGGFADVEQFTLERENAVLVATDDTQSGDGQRFGRVSFRQDQRAVDRVLGSGVVGVLQFGDALELGVLLARALLVQLVLRLEFGPCHH